MKIKKIEQKPIITGAITKFIPMPNIKSIVEQVQEASSIAQEAAEQAEIFSQEAAQSARASAQSVSTIVQLKQDTKNFANVASEKAEIAMRASENTQSIIASVTEAAAQAVDNATQAKNAKTAAQLAASKVAQAELKAQQIVQMADDIQNNIENINATKDIVLDAKNRTIEAKNSAINANDNAQNAKVAAEAAKNSAVIAKEAAEDAAEEAKSIANDIKQAAEVAAEAIESASSANSSAQSASASASSAATSAETASNSAQSAETAKTAAEASATAAGTSATNAEAAKTAALAAKGAAETAAASAEESATDASNYAGVAEAAEQDAQAAKTAAEASATAAAGSASAASGSASQAAQKASEASESATAAQTSATNAETARTGAETARTGAEAAQSKAEEAAANAEQSATTAEWYAERVERFLPTDTASGEIASFPDGADGAPMQSVVVSMEPVQDLHGYDHPWPAGGGVNKWDEEYLVGYYSASGGFVASDTQLCSKNLIPVVPGAAHYLKIGDVALTSTASSYCCYGQNGEFLRRVASIGPGVINMPDDTYYIKVNYGTPYGNTYNYNIAVNYPSSVTTYSPYSNICPISGRTGAEVTRAGINIFDKATVVQNAYIDDTNGVEKVGTGSMCSGYISVVPNATYYIKSDQTMAAWGAWYDADKTYIRGITGYIASAQDSEKTKTAPSNARYMRLTIVRGGTGNVDTFSVNYPATDHDYHSYTGETYSATFPSTVYGGTWGVTEGEIASQWAIVDGGTLTWSKSGTSGFYCNAIADAKAGSVSGGYNLVRSSIYKPESVASLSGLSNGAISMDSGRHIQVKDTRFTDAVTFKEAMSGVQFLYVLATPTEISVDPHTIPTRLGTNNVWSDAGETAVTYKADVQLYIDKKITDLQALILENISNS